MANIHSGFELTTLDATASETTTEYIRFHSYSHGVLFNTSGGSITVTFWTRSEKNGTVCQLLDKTGAAVTITLADARAHALPDAVAGLAWIGLKLSSGSETLKLFCKR